MTALSSRLSLKLQVYSIVALAVAVFVVVGALSMLTANRQQRHDSDYQTFIELERTSEALAFDLLDARRREKDFLARRTERDIEKHAAALADTRLRLKQLGDGWHRPETSRIAATLDTYADTFARVVATQKRIGYTEKEGALGNLRGSVHAVEQLLKDHDEPRLAVSMLMMRRHEKDFLARRELKYSDEMAARAQEFSALLANSALPEAIRSDITSKMQGYHQDFAVVVQATVDLATLVDSLSQHYARIEPDIESLRAHAHQQAADAKAARDDAAKFGLWATLAAIGLGTMLIAVLGGAIARGIYRPLLQMTQAMRRLSQGELDSPLPLAERGDEVGAMGRALKVFRDNALAARDMHQRQEILRAQGEQAKLNALNAMAETVERESRLAVDRVAERTRSMAGTAQTMAQSAERVGGDAQGVAAAADQALANAQTVAAASEQLNASIGEISQQVTTAAKVTCDAVETARQAQESIVRLSEAVGRIDEVSALISDIAGQTNLLALNATIEAARAGEAGKGFAVVAGEVKSLAAQTARATGDISTQVAAIQATTRHAVDAVGRIVVAIDRVEGIASTIAGAIEEQGAATGEIARNVTQTSDAALEVSRRIAEVSQEALGTGNQAAQVKAISAEVSEAIQMLRDTLIEVVRTSTREVDRRHEPRPKVHRQVSISVGGTEIAGATVDLGRNGASIIFDSELPVSPGSRLNLRLEGVAAPIEAELVARDGRQAHLHFLVPLEPSIQAA